MCVPLLLLLLRLFRARFGFGGSTTAPTTIWLLLLLLLSIAGAVALDSNVCSTLSSIHHICSICEILVIPLFRNVSHSSVLFVSVSSSFPVSVVFHVDYKKTALFQTLHIIPKNYSSDFGSISLRLSIKVISTKNGCETQVLWCCVMRFWRMLNPKSGTSGIPLE